MLQYQSTITVELTAQRFWPSPKPLEGLAALTLRDKTVLVLEGQAVH